MEARAIPLGESDAPVQDPQQKLQQKLLTGTQRDIGNVQLLLAEEKTKAEQLEAQINELKSSLGVVNQISRRGSIQVSLSKKGGAKLGIKMAMDSGVDAIVVTDVTEGGQAEGQIPARARLQTINGQDVADMEFKEATNLISQSGDIVSFTFSPAKGDGRESVSTAGGTNDSERVPSGISFVPGKSSSAAAPPPVLKLGTSKEVKEKEVTEKKVTLMKEDGKSLGFTLSPPDASEYISVNKVTTGGAAEGKLRSGDKVSHVNGINIKGAELPDVGAMIKGAIGEIAMIIVGNVHDVVADEDSSEEEDAEA
jgi:C-terminal processing protease CtpA/Prc